MSSSSIDRDDRINDLIEELYELQEENEAGEPYLPSKFLRQLATRVVNAEMEAEKLRGREAIAS